MIADRVHSILKENKLFAKKKFGQNFLLDKNILNKIVEMSEVNSNDTIIEIGPGLGCLTEFLAMQAKKVICYEIDKDMVEILKDNLSSYNNIEIMHMDFLKADLSMYNNPCDNVKVVANLPYYITTPIIFKLLSETQIKQFTFMVQKEVGERLTGKPNTKDYNALSVVMNYKTDSKLAYKVSRNSFHPAPNVESALLVVKTKEVDSSGNFGPKFLEFVQNIFEQRRKTIINNISNNYSISKDKLMKIFEENNISIDIRAEALDIEQIKNIYILLKSNL